MYPLCVCPLKEEGRGGGGILSIPFTVYPNRYLFIAGLSFFLSFFFCFAIIVSKYCL